MSISCITITKNAASEILKRKGSWKVSVKSRGCSGLSYDFQESEISEKDIKVEMHGATLWIDPKAEFFIIGSVLDFEETTLRAGFFFINPNEKSRCGCGESFNV